MPGCRTLLLTHNKSKALKPKSWQKPGLSRVERVIAFVEGLQLTSGKYRRQEFRLKPWQKDIVRGIYRRGVKTALVTLPRGKAKRNCAPG